VGYSGSGAVCTNVDECADTTSNCDPNSNCTDSIGSYSCACNAGWVGTGTRCSDIDECVADHLNTCQSDEVCQNSAGGFRCACAPGTTRHSVSGRCVNVDECAAATTTALCRRPNSHCVDTDGSFSCLCNTGFQVASTSSPYLDCVDVNECSGSQNQCVRRADCVNTLGSHYCCTDDPTGLTTALQAGGWTGSTTCAALAPTLCIGGAAARRVVAWFCARSCGTCAEVQTAGTAAIPTLPPQPVTATTMSQLTTTRPVVVTSTATLQVILEGTAISADLVAPTLQRLASLVQVPANRLLAGTFLEQSGRLQVIIIGGLSSDDPTAEAVRSSIAAHLSISPEQIESGGVTATVSLETQATTSATALGVSTDASNTASVSVVVIVLVVAGVLLLIAVGAVWSRSRRDTEEFDVTLDSLYPSFVEPGSMPKHAGSSWSVVPLQPTEDSRAHDPPPPFSSPSFAHAARVGPQGQVFADGAYITSATYRSMPNTYDNPVFSPVSPGVGGLPTSPSGRMVDRSPHQPSRTESGTLL
jgi:hypothetical protein